MVNINNYREPLKNINLHNSYTPIQYSGKKRKGVEAGLSESQIKFPDYGHEKNFFGLSESTIKKAINKYGPDVLPNVNDSYIKLQDRMGKKALRILFPSLDELTNIDYLFGLELMTQHMEEPEKIISLLTDDTKFNTEKMKRTLLDIALIFKERVLSSSWNIKKTDKTYGYMIDKGHVYIRFGKLGKGSFKTVSKTIRLDNLTAYATSSMKDPLAEKLFNYECTALWSLRGLSNIMPPFESSLITSTKNQKTKFLLTQVMMDGTAADLNNHSFHHTLNVWKGVARGLAHIHSKGSTHGDIKPPNILFKGDKNNLTHSVKGYVHDFGSFAKIGKYNGGTTSYWPPEYFPIYGKYLERKKKNAANPGEMASIRSWYSKAMSEKATTKVDSFALGVSLWQSIIGDYKLSGCFTDKQHVFGEADDQQEIDDTIKHKIQTLNTTKIPVDELNMKKTALLIVRELTLLDPSKRMSCEEAATKLEELAKRFDIKEQMNFPSIFEKGITLNNTDLAVPTIAVEIEPTIIS